MLARMVSSFRAKMVTASLADSASFFTSAFNSRSSLLSARICRLISQRSDISPFFSTIRAAAPSWMNAFNGNAPTYHITLFDDAPALVWDFHSLMLAITLVFSFMLTDTDNPIHMCKNCGKVFIAEKHDSLFCSADCRTQYRAQKKQEKK